MAEELRERLLLLQRIRVLPQHPHGGSKPSSSRRADSGFVYIYTCRQSTHTNKIKIYPSRNIVKIKKKMLIDDSHQVPLYPENSGTNWHSRYGFPVPEARWTQLCTAPEFTGQQKVHGEQWFPRQQLAPPASLETLAKVNMVLLFLLSFLSSSFFLSFSFLSSSFFLSSFPCFNNMYLFWGWSHVLIEAREQFTGVSFLLRRSGLVASPFHLLSHLTGQATGPSAQPYHINSLVTHYTSRTMSILHPCMTDQRLYLHIHPRITDQRLYRYIYPRVTDQRLYLYIHPTRYRSATVSIHTSTHYRSATISILHPCITDQELYIHLNHLCRL